VPLAWAGNKPGHEIEHPMAVVILGGLVTSTLLNLGLMPALYLAFGRTRTRAEDEEANGISSSKTIGVNGPSHAVQPAHAAVSLPASSVD
jgi:AcrB/AcrD/AcrF family